jgi:hypothetical protein
MSSRGALIALLALSGRGSAQDAGAWRDSTYRLTREVRSVRDSISEADPGVKEIARRSGLVVSATTDARAIAAEVLARFDSARRHWFGTLLPDAHGFRIILRRGDTWSFGSRIGAPQSLTIAGLPDTGTAPRATPMVSREQLSDAEGSARTFLFEYGGLMMRAAADSVQRWLPTGLLLNLPEESRREQAMYALVTGNGKAQRACVRGDSGACAYSLGLRQWPDSNAGAQYYTLTRADLLLTALELGGPGAWERLGASQHATIEARLAAAAGMPTDSLLVRWRDGLLALQPNRSPLTLSTAAVLLGWTILVLAAGLGIARWV